MTATVVRFERWDEHWFSLRFAYDPRLVEMVKTVPPKARDYDDDTRTWFVRDNHVVALACDMVALGYPIVGLQPLGPDAVMVVCGECGKSVTFVRSALGEDLP